MANQINTVAVAKAGKDENYSAATISAMLMAYNGRLRIRTCEDNSDNTIIVYLEGRFGTLSLCLSIEQAVALRGTLDWIGRDDKSEPPQPGKDECHAGQ